MPNAVSCFQANAPTSGGTLGPITAFGAISGGSSYVTGTYTNTPLTGGSGFGATATVTVSGGAVTSVALTNAGSHYAAGDILSAATATIGGGSGVGFSIPVNSVSTTGTGFVGLLGTITAGTGGTAGTYPNVSLTGGSGSGATANITVSGGGVTAVVILNPGLGYVVGDTLSAASGSIGSVSGFSVPVSSVAINNSLAGGSVTFYVPGTTTFKSTWFNADQASTHLNPNPVPLDANGCAVIYGAGIYREILKDSVGNTIFDQTTTDTSANNNSFWAGLASGTANVITVVDPGFNGTDGSIIGFTAIATNTSSVTLNPSGFGAIPVLKVTTAGPVALVGNGTEIVQNNPIWVQFSASLNSFLITNPPIASASGANSPMCGALGLKITNNAVTPNTIINLTASQAITQTVAGLVINRSTISLTNINTTTGTVTATANGFDGEAIPASTAGWLYVWLIDNGAAPAGLLSLAAGNGLSPNLPSGYTYKCRLGAMRFDTSGNLLRTLQLGAQAQYVVTATTNTANLPQIAISTSGSVGSLTAPTWVAESVSAFVPPSATSVRVSLICQAGLINTVGNRGCMVAPNNGYGAINSTSNPPPLAIDLSQNQNAAAIASITSIVGDLLLESMNVYFASTIDATVGGTSIVAALGWRDAIDAN